MKTLIDLRDKEDEKVISEIEAIYKKPLKIISFRGQPIKPCLGCWNCWLKTPGRCAIKDQMAETYSAYVISDTVILLMDTAQGFINHNAKAYLDRTIPHYHPYIEIVDGECHHVARYERYPDLAFYYDTAGLSKQEEQVIEDYLYRTAFHFRSDAYRIINEGNLMLRPLEPRLPKNRCLPFASIQPMEKLVIYNGSPRRSRSNSGIILEKVVESLGDRVEIRDLKERDRWTEWLEAFPVDENVMFLMPLYVHAMPSHVMNFFEGLEPSAGSISFLVQSGFPESSQSHFLEAYLELLALRLKRTYLGTAIKGGVEGMQLKPLKAQERSVAPMVKTVSNLVCEGAFKPGDIKKLAEPVRFGTIVIVLFKLFARAGLVNSFWNQQLKANNAFDNSFDRPYNDKMNEKVVKGD